MSRPDADRDLYARDILAPAPRIQEVDGTTCRRAAPRPENCALVAAYACFSRRCENSDGTKTQHPPLGTSSSSQELTKSVPKDLRIVGLGQELSLIHI